MCRFLATSCLLLPRWSPCFHILPKTFQQNITHNSICCGASSAKHSKLKFFQPFQIQHCSTWAAQWVKETCSILLSSKCGTQFGHALLVRASSSLPFWRKDRDHSLWMASSGRFEATSGDLQERKGTMDGPEKSSWKAEVSLVLTDLGHQNQKEAYCHFTSSFLCSLVPCFLHSKFLFLLPWGTNQISHATGSNSVVMHKMRVRMNKFS